MVAGILTVTEFNSVYGGGMKENLSGKAVAFLVFALVMGAMGYAVLLAIRGVVAMFASLDPQVAMVTAIGSCVALAASWIISRGMRMARQESKATKVREETAATYQLFVDFWRNVSAQPDSAQRFAPGLTEKLEVLDRLLLLYGSAGVIRAHSDLREIGREKSMQDARARDLFGEALLAIRKDLGSDASKEVVVELRRLLSPAEASAARPSAARLANNA